MATTLALVAGCSPAPPTPEPHHKVVLQAVSTYGATMKIHYFGKMIEGGRGTVSTPQSHWSITIDDTTAEPFYHLSVDSGAISDQEGNGMNDGSVTCRISIDGRVAAEQTHTFPTTVPAMCLASLATVNSVTGTNNVAPARSLDAVIAAFPPALRSAMPTSVCETDGMSSNSVEVVCKPSRSGPAFVGLVTDDVLDSVLVFTTVNAARAATRLEDMKKSTSDEVLVNADGTIGARLSTSSDGHIDIEYANTETGLTLDTSFGEFTDRTAAKTFLTRVGLNPQS